MRIGLLHQYELGTSGSGLYAARVIERLVHRGHRVSVISHDRHPEEISFADAAFHESPGDPVALHRARPGQVRCSAYGLRPGLNPVAYPRAEEPDSPLFTDLSDSQIDDYLEYHTGRVVAIAAAERLEVLHANHEVPAACIASRVQGLTGLPYVVVAHGSTLEYLSACDARFRRLTEVGLRGAEHVVALNADVRQRLLGICPDIEPRVVTVPVGVDVEMFRPEGDTDETSTAPARPLGSASPPSGPVVAYVGRLALEKGVHVLLAAFPMLAELVPGVRLVVMGEGAAGSHLERMVTDLGLGDLDAAKGALERATAPHEPEWAAPVLRFWRQVDSRAYLDAARASCVGERVIFTGSLPSEEVSRRLARAEVLVVPSLIKEAFPLVVLEALACGVPPMAPARGGLGAVLEEIADDLGPLAGLLSLDADPDAMVRAIAPAIARLLDLVGVPARRAEVRRACRRAAVSRYSWEHVVDRLESVYALATSSTGQQIGRFGNVH